MKPRSFAVGIVDDDPRLLESLGDLLKSVGYAVKAFPSGDAFLDQASLDDIGCLVTDVSMPGMNGYELQQLVSLRAPGLAVIFITGNSDLMEAAEADGFSRGKHFQKLCGSHALLEAVAEAVKTRS